MTLLHGHRVLALEGAAQSALARLLSSLGASVAAVSLPELPEQIASASFLLEELGLSRLADAGWLSERFEREAPRLIHVSVTPFGSTGPRARWLGNELIASAMSGVLRLTGTPDRAPVKEALDACVFHAQMVAGAAALAAHYERGTGGRGQHVDVSVQEVAFSRQVNSILVWQFERRKLARVGGALNYGAATVRCIWAIADGWCFHTLMTGRFGAPANQALSDWISECGLRNPLRDVDWSTYNRSTLPVEQRADWEAAIAAFFRTRTKQDIAVEGRRRGINATVVAEPADVLRCAHLQARKFWGETPGAALRDPNGQLVRVPGRFVSVSMGEPARPTEAPRGLGAGPLAGVRVLDFSWALVGSITTKTLGDLGADVIKVESRTRPCLTRIDVQVGVSRAGNFDDKPWFAHLNTSKRSLALDMKKIESREVLGPLLAWADVVVENFSPGTMEKLGLDYHTLAKDKPGLIMVSGSVYGQTGPLAREWGVDGTGAALSGRTYLTGWPDRDPVIPGAVPYGDVIVPYVMAAALSAALQHRRETGRGAHIDASMYEICVQQMYDAIVEAQQGPRPERCGNRDPRIYLQGVYAVKGPDQWIAISLPAAADWQRLRAFAQLPDAPDANARDAAIAAWTRDQSGAELSIRLQSAGIAAGVVQDIEDLMQADPQMAARGGLLTVEHPLLGPFGHLRTPMTFSRSILEPYRSPGIGEHSVSIARTLCGLDDSRIAYFESLKVFQ
jgi:crotonobetainyl-CoA:carnitine CoA-transferase CaiB-like acyl-CoA transferase